MRVTAILIDVIGIIANCLSLSYFIKRQNKGLGNRLLMLLNSCDLLVCCTNLPTAISYQVFATTGNEVARTCYLTCAIIYGISFDCTGFATCLVSATRTIKVCKPFFSIKVAWTVTSFIVYFFYSSVREITSCYFMFIKPLEDIDTVKKYYIIIYSSGTTANVTAVVLSSIITAYWLLSKSELDGKTSNSNRHATVTILILSAAFFVINAVFI